MSLEDTRRTIDAIDAQIVRLLDARAEAGREAAALKQRCNQPLRNLGRENEVLAKVAALSDGSMPKRALENIYRTIMGETLALEAGGGDSADRGCRCGGADSSLAGKKDVRGEIIENVQVAPGFFRMTVNAPALGGVFQPGQFFQLRLEAGGMFLRRPFAPSEVLPNGFAFVYAVVGGGTGLMARLGVGTVVSILAPLGNAYSLPPAGSTALLLGGGCGGPSLAPLARRLKEMSIVVDVVIGARSSAMLLEHETFAAVADRLVVGTDDGTRGCRGTVIDAFRRENLPRPGCIYACGPHAMLKAAAALADELGVACQVSLEERMACGFGACLGCAVPVKTPSGSVYRRVCHEGPVFDARSLAWSEM